MPSLIGIFYFTGRSECNGSPFHDVGKMAAFVDGAYTAAHAAASVIVLPSSKATHTVPAVGFLSYSGKKTCHDIERIASIEIVGVDNGKWLFNGALAHHNRMVGSPWLCAALGHGVAFRKSIDTLEHHLYRYVALILRSIFSRKASSKSCRITNTTLPKPARMAS